MASLSSPIDYWGLLMLSLAQQPMGFDLGYWRLWKKKCLEACRQVYAPQGKLALNVALGPKERGRHRPRADGVLATPHALLLIKVKRRPSPADVDRLLQHAQLLGEHPRSPEQQGLPVRPLLVVRFLDLHVAQAARERGMTMHQAGPDGRLLDLPRTWPRRGSARRASG